MALKPNEQAKQGRCGAINQDGKPVKCSRWKGHTPPHRGPERGQFYCGERVEWDDQKETGAPSDELAPQPAEAPAGETRDPLATPLTMDVVIYEWQQVHGMLDAENVPRVGDGGAVLSLFGRLRRRAAARIATLPAEIQRVETGEQEYDGMVTRNVGFVRTESASPGAEKGTDGEEVVGDAVATRDAALRALRKLRQESAAVLALAENELREAIVNMNLAVFKLRIKEADAALALPPEGPAWHHMKHGDSTLCGAEKARGNSYYEWAYVNCPDCLRLRGSAPPSGTEGGER